MTKTIWVDTTGASTTYVPREKPIQESVAPFSGTISGAAPATTNLGTNSGQRILAADGTWIPQPAFTSGGADQLETLRPSVISTSYSANPPTVTDSAKAYDSDTNHATTFGQWYAAQEARINNRVDIFSLTTWASKTQTWTAATINVSRSYAILQDGESASVDGLSSKTSSVKYEFSTNNGSSWTTLGTDTAASIPTAPQTLSMALGSLTPTMGNILVKVTITRGGGGTIYEDGVSLPGLTGEVDLKLFDVWIDGTYAGGAGNITCNNLTVTGDATFQNKIYDSTASAGTTGQVLKVAANGKVTWATDSAGTGTVTSITTTGANGVTISGGSTQTITTSGTFALALGNITPTSISTGTGSFSGDVEFAASIKSPNGSNSPVTIVPDGTGDLHVNADSLRLGDNNANATIATNGTGDLILTTHEGSATEGVIRLYDGANGNITLTPNGTGQVQVGSDQVVTLIASQTLTNKTLSSNSVWNGNVIGSAYGGAGTVNGILKANGSGTVSAASAGTDYVTSVSVTSPVSNTGTTANPTIALASSYGDTQNPYGSKTANYFLAAPDGSAGVPTWRSIVAADIPTLNQNTTGTAANVTGIVAVANGGTGLTSLTAGYIPYGSGTSAFGSSANLFWDSANSRLGVGTASPTQKLDVLGRLKFRASSGGASAGVWYTNSSGSEDVFAGLQGASSTDSWGVYSNGDWRFTITNSGSIGIGTTSPSAKLQVNSSGNTPLNLVGSTACQINLNDGTQNANWGLGVGGVGITGIASPSTYPLVMYTNGSERMRIDSSGNLGVGTSSPSTKLHVANGGSNAQATFVGTTGSPYITVVANSGTTILGNESNGGWVGTTGSQAFVFKTNDTERMRIDSSGNVGIGTSPSAKLDVNGQVRAAYASGFQVDNAGTMLGKLYYSGGLILDRAASTSLFIAQNGSNQVTLDSSGNLGIGVTPAFKLHTYIASGTSMFKFESGANTGIYGYWTRPNQSYIQALNLDNNGDKDFSLYDATNGQVADRYYPSSTGYRAFFTNGSERMRIDSSGNVGIGTTSPTARITVNGNNTGSAIDFTNTTSSTGRSYRWVSINSGGFAVEDMSASGAERLRIDSSGNLGIGTSSPDGKLEVSGKLKVRGTTSANDLVQVWGVSGASGSYSTLELIKTADTSGNFIFRGFTAGGTGTAPKIAFGNWSATPFDGAQMTLDTSSGNVGIGTSSPTNKLQVNGVMVGNNASGSYTKGFGGILTTTSTSTPTGGSSGDFALIY